MKHITPFLVAAAVLAGCEDPPPPDIEVNVTVEEHSEPASSAPKDERGTVQGNGQRFTRP